MRRRISTTALLLAWLCANGAVWNVVQLVGWAKMFHTYAQVMPATTALQVTFDGSAPCDLCQISQAAQDTAREQLPRDDALGGSDRLLLVCESAAPVVMRAPDFSWPGLEHEAGSERNDPVPLPPPRV